MDELPRAMLPLGPTNNLPSISLTEDRLLVGPDRCRKQSRNQSSVSENNNNHIKYMIIFFVPYVLLLFVSPQVFIWILTLDNRQHACIHRINTRHFVVSVYYSAYNYCGLRLFIFFRSPWVLGYDFLMSRLLLLLEVFNAVYLRCLQCLVGSIRIKLDVAAGV